MSKRQRIQFTVDAVSVQGIEGATVTFRSITVATFEACSRGQIRDAELVRDHVVAWTGFVDDDDNPLPDPGDEGVVGQLYRHELAELVRLLLEGPTGESAKN